MSGAGKGGASGGPSGRGPRRVSWNGHPLQGGRRRRKVQQMASGAGADAESGTDGGERETDPPPLGKESRASAVVAAADAPVSALVHPHEPKRHQAQAQAPAQAQAQQPQPQQQPQPMVSLDASLSGHNSASHSHADTETMIEAGKGGPLESPLYDVIVIGAGVSGLYCAKTLVEVYRVPQDRVLVLEANSYVGGRVKANDTFVPGVRVDLGAELIHGGLTPLTDMIRAHGLETFPLFTWAHGDGGPSEERVNGGYGMYYLGKEKRLFRFDEGDEEFQRLTDVLCRLAEFAQPGKPPIEPSLSLRDYLTQEGISPEMQAMAEAGYGNTMCTDLEHISLSRCAIWEHLWLAEDDGDCHFTDSFVRIIELLRQGLNIQTNTPVRCVDSSPQPTAAVTTSGYGNGYGNGHATGNGNGNGHGHDNPEVRVLTADGKVYRARHVVCSVPVSVLRDGDIRFVPPFPERKLVALHGTIMRRAVKVFFKFSQLCYPEGVHGAICADSFVPEFWFRDLREGQAQHGVSCVVVAFLTGPWADAFAVLPEDAAVARILRQLDDMFRQTHSGAAAASAVCIGHLVQDWGTNPFVRGGYGSPLPGYPTDCAQRIAEPLGDSVFFAGEASSDNGATTVQSAMQSGYRAASQVMAATPHFFHSRL